MNPYDFVRIDWSKGVKRQRPQLHHRFSGLSGRVHGTITTLTPLFIREPKEQGEIIRRIRYQQHITTRSGEAVIPGSSLKGLIRSLVETIGYGCWWLVDATYERKLPSVFRQCQRLDRLCVACRMFGLIQGDTSLRGHVGFDDARCTRLVEHDPIYTIILSTPKPHHAAFYQDGPDNLAGRKFYFHHATPPVDRGGWRPKHAVSQSEAQNQYIRPLGAGSVFTFSGHFDNLAPDELRVLLYALVLEEKMRHKIGYGKPAGLGSVHIELTELELFDHEQRYGASDGGKKIYKDEDLESYVGGQVAVYRDDDKNITLQDLRRIWQWPGRNDIQYPSWQWFKDNPGKPIPETP